MNSEGRASSQKTLRFWGRGPRSFKRLSADFFRHLVLLCGVVTMILPLIWLIATSFKTQEEAIRFPPTFVPLHPILTNYLTVFSNARFLVYMANSVIVSVSVVVGALFLCSLTGYVLAKFEFPGNRVFLMMVIGKLMIPLQVMIIPLYLLMIRLGWQNTLIALIIPNEIISAFGIFLMRQFMLGFPESIMDSATIDGCGYFSIYWRILLPNMKHALFTLGIFLFVWSWSMFLWPLIVIDTPSKMTIQLGIQMYSSEYYTEYGPKTAGIFVSLIPVFAVFFAFQKRVLQNIAMSGLKD